MVCILLKVQVRSYHRYENRESWHHSFSYILGDVGLHRPSLMPVRGHEANLRALWEVWQMWNDLKIWLAFMMTLGTLWSSAIIGSAAPLVPEVRAAQARNSPGQQPTCDAPAWPAQRRDVSDTPAGTNGAGTAADCADHADVTSWYGQLHSLDWSTLYTGINCGDSARCMQHIIGTIDDHDVTGIFGNAPLQRLWSNSERFESPTSRSAESFLDHNTGNSVRLPLNQGFAPQIFDDNNADEASKRSSRRLWGKILNIGLLLIFLEKYLWRS